MLLQFRKNSVDDISAGGILKPGGSLMNRMIEADSKIRIELPRDRGGFISSRSAIPGMNAG